MTRLHNRVRAAPHLKRQAERLSSARTSEFGLIKLRLSAYVFVNVFVTVFVHVFVSVIVPSLAKS